MKAVYRWRLSSGIYAYIIKSSNDESPYIGEQLTIAQEASIKETVSEYTPGTYQEKFNTMVSEVSKYLADNDLPNVVFKNWDDYYDVSDGCECVDSDITVKISSKVRSEPENPNYKGDLVNMYLRGNDTIYMDFHMVRGENATISGVTLNKLSVGEEPHATLTSEKNGNGDNVYGLNLWLDTSSDFEFIVQSGETSTYLEKGKYVDNNYCYDGKNYPHYKTNNGTGDTIEYNPALLPSGTTANTLYLLHLSNSGGGGGTTGDTPQIVISATTAFDFDNENIQITTMPNGYYSFPVFNSAIIKYGQYYLTASTEDTVITILGGHYGNSIDDYTDITELFVITNGFDDLITHKFNIEITPVSGKEAEVKKYDMFRCYVTFERMEEINGKEDIPGFDNICKSFDIVKSSLNGETRELYVTSNQIKFTSQGNPQIYGVDVSGDSLTDRIKCYVKRTVYGDNIVPKVSFMAPSDLSKEGSGFTIEVSCLLNNGSVSSAGTCYIKSNNDCIKFSGDPAYNVYLQRDGDGESHIYFNKYPTSLVSQIKFTLKQGSSTFNNESETVPIIYDGTDGVSLGQFGLELTNEVMWVSCDEDGKYKFGLPIQNVGYITSEVNTHYFESVLNGKTGTTGRTINCIIKDKNGTVADYLTVKGCIVTADTVTEITDVKDLSEQPEIEKSDYDLYDYVLYEISPNTEKTVEFSDYFIKKNAPYTVTFKPTANISGNTSCQLYGTATIQFTQGAIDELIPTTNAIKGYADGQYSIDQIGAYLREETEEGNKIVTSKSGYTYTMIVSGYSDTKYTTLQQFTCNDVEIGEMFELSSWKFFLGDTGKTWTDETGTVYSGDVIYKPQIIEFVITEKPLEKETVTIYYESEGGLQGDSFYAVDFTDQSLNVSCDVKGNYAFGLPITTKAFISTNESYTFADNGLTAVTISYDSGGTEVSQKYTTQAEIKNILNYTISGDTATIVLPETMSGLTINEDTVIKKSHSPITLGFTFVGTKGTQDKTFSYTGYIKLYITEGAIKEVYLSDKGNSYRKVDEIVGHLDENGYWQYSITSGSCLQMINKGDGFVDAKPVSPLDSSAETIFTVTITNDKGDKLLASKLPYLDNVILFKNNHCYIQADLVAGGNYIIQDTQDGGITHWGTATDDIKSLGRLTTIDDVDYFNIKKPRKITLVLPTYANESEDIYIKYDGNDGDVEYVYTNNDLISLCKNIWTAMGGSGDFDALYTLQYDFVKLLVDNKTNNYTDSNNTYPITSSYINEDGDLCIIPISSLSGLTETQWNNFFQYNRFIPLGYGGNISCNTLIVQNITLKEETGNESNVFGAIPSSSIIYDSVVDENTLNELNAELEGDFITNADTIIKIWYQNPEDVPTGSNSKRYRACRKKSNGEWGPFEDYCVDYEPGTSGTDGKTVRGPYYWQPNTFYYGDNSEKFIDLVLFEHDADSNVYECLVEHTSDFYDEPSAYTEYITVNGVNYWKRASKESFLATKMLYSELAKIENLTVDTLVTEHTQVSAHTYVDDSGITHSDGQGGNDVPWVEITKGIFNIYGIHSVPSISIGINKDTGDAYFAFWSIKHNDGTCYVDKNTSKILTLTGLTDYNSYTGATTTKIIADQTCTKSTIVVGDGLDTSLGGIYRQISTAKTIYYSDVSKGASVLSNQWFTKGNAQFSGRQIIFAEGSTSSNMLISDVYVINSGLTYTFKGIHPLVNSDIDGDAWLYTTNFNDKKVNAPSVYRLIVRHNNEKGTEDDTITKAINSATTFCTGSTYTTYDETKIKTLLTNLGKRKGTVDTTDTFNDGDKSGIGTVGFYIDEDGILQTTHSNPTYHKFFNISGNIIVQSGSTKLEKYNISLWDENKYFSEDTDSESAITANTASSFLKGTYYCLGSSDNEGDKSRIYENGYNICSGETGLYTVKTYTDGYEYVFGDNGKIKSITPIYSVYKSFNKDSGASSNYATITCYKEYKEDGMKKCFDTYFF